ncbi:hypothetical protein HPG69_011706 [Diceros bicornis minor]|uniref:Eukaryotic translation initiation factor 3 subunit H n=1 Tax=Diceros bicornis minor TaxID=77932 RepID=A0A7J7EHF2_DICBM|nr:hypothetical protein HPG69_011706 [Diceros bicornis minor]
MFEGKGNYLWAVEAAGVNHPKSHESFPMPFKFLKNILTTLEKTNLRASQKRFSFGLLTFYALRCSKRNNLLYTLPIRRDEILWGVQYQMEMMRSLRHVNIDHLHVGWYQSTYYGSFVTRALLDSQFSYQHAIEESVVLIYDPIKTAQGSLSLKAYRLTPKLMEVCKEKDFSPEALKKGNITFEHMFEEVPIVIKNSHLINVLMWELEKKSAVADKHELLSLASSNHLGKNLQLLMDRVDEMSQDIYQQRRQQENMQRQSRGEPPLPEEDLSKLFKPPQPPARMDSLLIAGQINTYCQNIKEFTAQNLGKLFMAQALQEYNN